MYYLAMVYGVYMLLGVQYIMVSWCGHYTHYLLEVACWCGVGDITLILSEHYDY